MDRCFQQRSWEGSTKIQSNVSLFLSSLLFPLLYITPLYIVSRGRARHEADVIWKRICVSCFWVPFFSCALVDQARRTSPFLSVDSPCHDLIRLLGFGDFSIQKIVNAAWIGALPVLVLFSGSLVNLILEMYHGRPVMSRRRPVEWIRDIFVAPFTEEICFRSALMSFLWLGGMKMSTSIWFSPMVFGLSHVHHLHDMVYYRNIAWTYAIMNVLFQFLYTTVFGWYAAMLFAKTGQLMAPLAAHAVCNFYGVPRFGELRQMSRKYARCIIVCHIFGVCGFVAACYMVI
mmetsp:Transcript_1138/g.2336  ORF Transcript_1138/g.2336 Transcript_1138/m.2336 type:complete len:288 (+) Transcript_1138:66-929(+)